ncbi:hypothetical protein SAMN05421846_105133 [Chryseobacterium taeanense]|uniref:PKD domain-containing protein n=1 Tax=Chryseobacterium taeanense TaxID=311334 RepID=A0A1G8IYA6_9FLAO|nr:hypothetical protein [Chryseobacterium taeanense]SDI23420.1 hypothetical protein SAMN05421846_105133 [Chryseobacterium taeanense]
MNNQLSNISTQYRKFSKGQYVEHTQFNEFLDFFEDQDRLSRVMLQGVGIVCGLQPELIYKDRLLNSLQLSQGVAITTDGDLLTLNNTNNVSKDLYVSDLKTIDIAANNYTHFKVYDNFKVKYPAFYEGSKQIDLWELSTAEEAGSDFQAIKNLTNLEDKYLLLYLESFEKEVKPCRGVDCDNHGIQQIRNLKVLITTEKGINYILEKDKMQPHPLFLEGIMNGAKLERAIVENLITEKGAEAQFSYSDLKKLYSDILEKNNYGEAVFKKINAISEIVGIPAVNHEVFKNVLKESLSQTVGFQYVYDVVKDLMDTYFEITKSLPQSFTKCLPDLLSFPKHIMLGKLISDIQLDPARHRFYNSPVLDDEKATRKVKELLNRFKQQVQNFRYSGNFETDAQIKIIPSQKSGALGNKAIPFYYEINEDFLKAWNFDKTSQRSSQYNLAYNTDFLSSDAHIQKPLDFNKDKNSFYNIEGHINKSYLEVFNKITKIRDEQQLDFDVMVLSLAELVNNKDMFKAYFNEYLENHQGLEHKRGVEKGGTFLIVCENLKNAKVIADFSLPYICCTPKIEVKLALPDTGFCSKYGPVPFTVFPMNGDVEAIVAEGLSGGVEVIDSKYFFNPSKVSPELYNQAISFSVNGKPTDCTAEVIPQADIHIAVDSETVLNKDITETKVTFTVSGANFSDYTYSWDFFDSGEWVVVNPDKDGHVFYSYYGLVPERIPTIRVNVSGKGCTQEIVLSDWYESPSAPTVTVDSINFSDGGVSCCEGTIPEIKADASGPEIVFLKELTFKLTGKGEGASSFMYSWEKIQGPTVTLTGVNSPDLQVTDLVIGEYIFQLTVVDVESGLFAKSQEVRVNVSEG